MVQNHHIPVMLNEIIEAFRGVQTPEPRSYFDGTFGRGGHFNEVLKNFAPARAIGMDRDLSALDFGREKFSNEIQAGIVEFVHGNYSQFGEKNLGKFDMMLLDLGVSSPQLDEGSRGFSFYHEGPLDMRMDQTQEFTAADVVNTFDEEDLISIFKNLGEIDRPHRVVKAICHDRKENLFTSTKQLAGLIERVDGWRQKGFHPATRYFMALRLYVNSELESLETALLPIMESLKPGGRLAVLTFHSLEDRIVKNIFKSNEALGKPVNKKVIQPEWTEAKSNPRARSAKLRIFERGMHE